MKKFQSTLRVNFLFKAFLTMILAFAATSYANADQQAAQATHHTVEITGFKFIPEVLKLSAGDSVTWINKDVAPHNIINSTNKAVISPNLAEGQKFTYVATGPMDYVCGFHPSMKGKLVNQ